MTEKGDVRSSLAEMDRKLHDLQRELELIGRAPAGEGSRAEPTPPPPPPFSAPEPSSLAATTRQPAERPAPLYSAPPAPPTPDSEAHRIVADPRGNAARIVREAASRVAALSTQIEELQRLRDDLQRSVRELAAEYERGADSPAPSGPPTFAPTGPTWVEAPAPAPHGGDSPERGAAERIRWEGHVALDVGPFTNIGALSAFEQALARLPHAEEAYVRGFEGNRALIDLRLGGPVALLDEMRRSLGFPFAIVDAGPGALTLNLDAPAGPAALPEQPFRGG